MVAEEREASHDLLEQERAAADVTADLLSIESMSPGRGLHEQAEEQNAELLVVGSCDHGVLGRAMLGDDTRAALNGAPCAVAVAPRGYAEHPGPIANVGVAYNASPESIAALAVAGKLAAMTGATTHAVEVVSIPSTAYAGIVVSTFEEYIDEILQEANSRLEELPDVEGHAVYGLAGEELAVFGDQVDILVVGSRGYGPIRRLVLGSTVDYLERHARCALLVLPRSATSRGEDSTTSSELQATR
jgi:nucleotide-binding universal stress UspA family protein